MCIRSTETTLYELLKIIFTEQFFPAIPKQIQDTSHSMPTPISNSPTLSPNLRSDDKKSLSRLTHIMHQGVLMN